MKLQMKREVLAKLNRPANEVGSSFGTAQRNSEVIERGSNKFVGISRRLVGARGFEPRTPCAQVIRVSCSGLFIVDQ
jgi:hypothetical protein